MPGHLKCGGTGQETIKLRAGHNCWLCEGWSEFEFEYWPPEPIDEAIVPVTLHLSCDDF